jgi:hypothetical protein
MHKRLICFLSVVGINLFSAAQVTQNCTTWFEPQSLHAKTAAPNPEYDRPAVIFGKKYKVPPLRVRLIDAATGSRLENKSISVNYGWRWLEYPYPEHSMGAWSDAADRLSCESDVNGWIETPAHEVKPRGWYDGKYTRFPWPRPPSFTEVEIVAVTSGGFARVRLKPTDLAKFERHRLIVSVFDGWRTQLKWEKK